MAIRLDPDFSDMTEEEARRAFEAWQASLLDATKTKAETASLIAYRDSPRGRWTMWSRTPGKAWMVTPEGRAGGEMAIATLLRRGWTTIPPKPGDPPAWPQPRET